MLQGEVGKKGTYKSAGVQVEKNNQQSAKKPVAKNKTNEDDSYVEGSTKNTAKKAKK